MIDPVFELLREDLPNGIDLAHKVTLHARIPVEVVIYASDKKIKTVFHQSSSRREMPLILTENQVTQFNQAFEEFKKELDRLDRVYWNIPHIQ